MGAKLIPKGFYPHQKIYNYHKPIPPENHPKRKVPLVMDGADLKIEALDFSICELCGGKGKVWKKINHRRSRQVACACTGDDN